MIEQPCVCTCDSHEQRISQVQQMRAALEYLRHHSTESNSAFIHRVLVNCGLEEAADGQQSL